MSENFYTILTATGKAKLANSAVLGSKVNFKTLKVGDGNGAYYEPTESQTSLVREVWSGNVSSISVDENNPNWIVAETLIPATIGGFFIREAGIFDEDGDLIAISKLSETYKPVVSEGSIKDLCIKIVLEVSNVSSVTLKIDPTVIVATRKDIDVLQAKMDASNAQTAEEIKELDSKLSEQISELANEISNKNVVTPAIGYGMNNVIKNVGETSVSPKFTIQGKTVVNLLGKDGNCEDISKWSSSNSVLALDSSSKTFGNNCIKVSSSAPGVSYFWKSGALTNLLQPNKYYCISAYVKNGNCPSAISITPSSGSGWTKGYTNTTVDTTKFVRIMCIIATSTSVTGDLDIITNATASDQYFWVDGVMIEEITQTQYNNSDFQPSPYVDNYACLQNPYIEVRHDNLVRNGNGEEGIDWWNSWVSSLSLSNGYFTVTDNDKTTSGNMWQSVFVKPNTTYTLSVVAKSDGTLPLAIGFNEYDESSNLLNKWIENSVDATTIDTSIAISIMTNPKTRYLQIYLQGGKTKGDESKTGTVYFKQISMVEGTVVPSKYLTCRIERCVVEGKFADGDSLVLENGEVTGQINWKHKTLFGKDYDWQYGSDFAGYKKIFAPISTYGYALYLINNNGLCLKKYDYSMGVDYGKNVVFTNGINLEFSAADSDTGWAENINPNNDEVKAFMNGWYAVTSNGTRYTAWISINEKNTTGGAPAGSIYSVASGVNSLGQNKLNVLDGAKFNVNDIIAVQHDNWGWAQYAITAIAGGQLTLNNTLVVNVSDNKLVIKADNGTTNTSILNYCKNNVAPNYEGYQLHYKLPTPEPITDNNCHINGDIPKFDTGYNYLYLEAGIVLGEQIPYIYSSVASRYRSNIFPISSDITVDNSIPIGILFKNKVEDFTGKYKNLVFDSSTWATVINGSSQAYGRAWLQTYATGTTGIDTSATYTVDYKILSTIAPQIGSFKCNYEQDIVTAINNLEESVNNKQTHDSILDTIVDLSLYEQKIVSWLVCPWYNAGGAIWFSVHVPIAQKKTVPVISLSNLLVYVGGAGNNNITDKVSLAGVQYYKNSIQILFYISDATTITNIKSYGFEVAKLTIIADCRERL